MKKLVLAIALFLFSSAVLLTPTQAEAKPHQLTWTWPVANCDLTALAAADLVESELVYSTSAIPMPSDSDGPCALAGDPDAPAGALSVPVPITDTSLILNLQPGQTYYARIRVSAYVNGNWSSWSNQVEFTVPYGRPNIIRLSAGIGYWEAQLLSTTHIYGKKQT